MKKSSVSRMQGFMYFQILCYVLERWIRTQHQIPFGKNSWVGSKIHHTTEFWTRLTETRWNESGILHQGSPHCSSSAKSKSSWPKWATHHKSTDELFSCRCSMTSHGDIKTETECIANSTLVSLSFLGPGSEKKWYSTSVTDTKEIGTESLNWWWSNSEKADTQFSVQRVQVSRGTLKKQQKWKIINTLLRWWWYDWNCFSHNYFCLWTYLRSSVRFVWWIQCFSSKNGETRVGRTIRPIVRASKIVDDNTHTFDWSSCTQIYCKKYKERVERLSQQDRVIKICTDAGFLTTVEVGQYFVTKDTEEFSQFTEPVTCRDRQERSKWPCGKARTERPVLFWSVRRLVDQANQQSQNQMKMWIPIKDGETRAIPKHRNSCKNSEKILWMIEFLNTETHTQVLLMNHL